jgi:hypothetical protein
MKKADKAYLQCGYEDRCKKKNCLKCPRKGWHKINFTLAEEIAVEDFAVCDLYGMIDEIRDWAVSDDEEKRKWGAFKAGELELLQNVMKKLMHKMFKSEQKEKWR